MRGRKPTIKLNADEPQEAGKVPTCPRHLDKEGRREWRRVARRMRETGTIEERDRALLAVYCQAWSRMIHAEGELAKTGPVVKSPSGYPILSPWLSVISQSTKTIDRMAVELGLSPVSRARIKAAQPKKRLEPLPSGRFFTAVGA